jgi:hypothetical protein
MSLTRPPHNSGPSHLPWEEMRLREERVDHSTESPSLTYDIYRYINASEIDYGPGVKGLEGTIRVPSLNSQAPIQLSIDPQTSYCLPPELVRNGEEFFSVLLLGLHQLRNEIKYAPSLVVHRLDIQEGVISVTLAEDTMPGELIQFTVTIESYRDLDEIRMLVAMPAIYQIGDARKSYMQRVSEIQQSQTAQVNTTSASEFPQFSNDKHWEQIRLSPEGQVLFNNIRVSLEVTNVSDPQIKEVQTKILQLVAQGGEMVLRPLEFITQQEKQNPLPLITRYCQMYFANLTD